MLTWLKSVKSRVGVSRPRSAVRRRACEPLEDRIVPQATSLEYVTQLYSDLLQRAPDSGGASYWSGLAGNGSSDQVALGIMSSGEYRNDVVGQLYEKYLNRAADPAGLSFWSAALASESEAQVAAGIIASAEFYNAAGGTASGFLSALYQDALGRAVDSSGEAAYTALLDAGTSRATVANDVLTSPEYRTDLVEGFYETYLHRAADAGGLSYWVGQLDQGASTQDVIAGFVSAAEYMAAKPAAPVVTTPSAATTTSATNFTIAGTAESGTLVQVSSNGSVVGSEQLAGAQTAFSISVPLTSNAANNFTVTATNGLGNQSAATTVPTITQHAADTVTVTNPGSQSSTEGQSANLSITATDASSNALTYTATNLPGGLSINSTTGLISGTVAATAAASSPYTVVVTATAATSGATNSATFTWTVSSPVTVTSPGNQTSTEGAAINLPITATDNASGATLAYSATGLPGGLSINSTTGAITGTVAATAAASSPYTVVVTASDGTHSPGKATFTWTVSSPVTVTSPGNQTSTEGATVDLPITATDGASGTTLAYSATGLPGGLSINSSTGAITGTVAVGDATGSPYTVVVSASDGTHSPGTATFTWTVSSPVTVTSPGNQTSTEGAAINLPITATDNASGATLAYSATGLPGGLSIDSSTGAITGTIAASAATSSPYTVVVSASDGTHTPGTATFTWTVSSPVTVTSPGNQTSAEGTAINLPITATDGASGATLAYSATGLPGGLSINSSTGLISGTVAASAAASSPYTVVVTASDGTHSPGTATFTWTVSSPVSVTSPGNQTSTEGAAVNLAVSAADSASGKTLTYSATGLPNGLQLDTSSGKIGGVIASGDSKSSPYTVVVTATDGTNTGSATFTWTVSAPAMSVTPVAKQANHDGDTVSGVTVPANDGTTNALTYAATGLPNGLSINSSTGVISGTIAASADTSSPYTAAITVTDPTTSAVGVTTITWVVYNASDPLLVPPATQVNVKGGTVTGVTASATAANSTPITYSASNLPSGLSINSSTGVISGTIAATASNNSPYTVTVTAAEGSNSSSATITWVVTSASSAALPVSLSDPAWVTLPSGVRYLDVVRGTGTTAAAGNTITANYAGYLADGTLFNAGALPATGLSTSNLIAGWVDGIPGMQVGGVRYLDIPSSLGYGSSGSGTLIPANAELVFEISLTGVSS
jgi:FKBP-type peptidyl-prolyl cis-trans isomerase